MKKILVLLAVFYLSGCSSFGKGVAEAILSKDKEADTRQCEIKGEKFKGIKDSLEKGKVVKVLMIHGVGSHAPGYSTRIRENLSKELGLDVLSLRPKNITIIDPIDKKTEVANLRAFEIMNEDESQSMIFYELTWSNITNPGKKILDYDVSGEYKHKRAPFNNMMKSFLDDTVPDPMIYLMDKDNRILNATKQATCWMMGSKWDDLQDKQKKVCEISSHQQVKDLSQENIIFITHSLGSRIIMDSMTDIINQVSAVDGKVDAQSQMIIDELKTKQLMVFMMANQLPLLQISRMPPAVSNQIPTYCKKKGKKYNKRIFQKVNIVAFSDPNDLLSYDIPQSFVDNYMDSRMCPSVTNVSLNVAEVISAFGVSVVNPVAAHTEYDNDSRIINMMSNGMTDYKNNKELCEKCNFIKLK